MLLYNLKLHLVMQLAAERQVSGVLTLKRCWKRRLFMCVRNEKMPRRGVGRGTPKRAFTDNSANGFRLVQARGRFVSSSIAIGKFPWNNTPFAALSTSTFPAPTPETPSKLAIFSMANCRSHNMWRAEFHRFRKQCFNPKVNS